MSEERRPIGYWLKRLDGLIEENFERTLAGDGVTRRQWQTLNTLHERPSTRAEVAEALQPFLVDDPGADRRVIDELVVGGWVGRGEGSNLLELTRAGAAAHAALLERIQPTRQLLVRGVTQEDYLAAIDILRRMAKTWNEPAPEGLDAFAPQTLPHGARVWLRLLGTTAGRAAPADEHTGVNIPLVNAGWLITSARPPRIPR